jgi:3',5'-cyclic AMP phosphodiesterase CpdA
VIITLAHLSDVHLGPLPHGSIFSDFKGKRLIGGASWLLRRKAMHLRSIADAARASILAETPDHIALTGDLINIAGRAEFVQGAKWLREFASPERLSFVPGNHDTYVNVPHEEGLRHFVPWMQSDRHKLGDPPFPYLRLRRNVALIGINSGCPQSYSMAGGTLGQQQLQDLSHQLEMLGQQGFYRVVMIHHPPLPNLAPQRKALIDATALQDVLKMQGAELVLHGHNHRHMLNWLDTKSGPCPVIGVPSASMTGDRKHEASAWNLYRIRRHQSRWQTEMTTNTWNAGEQKFVAATSVVLALQ